MPLLGRNSISDPASQPLGLKAVRVVDIILDINHPRAEEYGGYDSIGTIFWADIDKGEGEKDKNRAPSAQPLFTHLKY